MFDTVTGKVKKTKQPRGGYINPKKMTVIQQNDNCLLSTEENIHPSLVGLVVDYLTRFMLGKTASEAFEISLSGASAAKQKKYAQMLVEKVKGLDDESICNACKLCGYDVCYRQGMDYFKPVDQINADEKTIANIRIMVNRSLEFLKEYGPVTLDGFDFKGGYTFEIANGDGDYLTEDTLWDFKVSKYSPTKEHTLQLLIYYIMGQHSIHKEFESIKRLGVFNPRLNSVYYIDISEIEKTIIDEVSKEIIGYDE